MAARWSGRASPRSRKHLMQRGSAHRIWSATPPKFSPTAGRAEAPPPFEVDPQPAPDIAWVAWLGAAVSPDTALARPYYLRAPDAKPQKDPLQKPAQFSAS